MMKFEWKNKTKLITLDMVNIKLSFDLIKNDYDLIFHEFKKIKKFKLLFIMH